MGGGVYENDGGSKRSGGGSPPRLITSSPEPPLIVNVKSSLVDMTQNWSLPPPPSTSTDSTPRKLTMRPEPAITLDVITKVSPSGTPTTTSVTSPGPPLIVTGSFWS